MEGNTIVVLLTVTVILLSVVIIALLAALTLVLVKLNHLVKSVNATATNLAAATEWLSPMKVFSYASKMFRK